MIILLLEMLNEFHAYSWIACKKIDVLYLSKTWLLDVYTCFYISATIEACPKNEEYKQCGTACQKNCSNYDKNVPCILKCVSGCFCKEPLIRGPNGKCIHKEECPARPHVPTRE